MFLIFGATGFVPVAWADLPEQDRVRSCLLPVDRCVIDQRHIGFVGNL